MRKHPRKQNRTKLDTLKPTSYQNTLLQCMAMGGPGIQVSILMIQCNLIFFFFWIFVFSIHTDDKSDGLNVLLIYDLLMAC